jgi:hypothetical protein
MPLRRYSCPQCGGGLSRTLFHPQWLSLESEKPEFHIPLAPVLLAIAILGLGLAFIHPALSFVVVMLVVCWIYWRYFSWLQCDACSCFFFGGQLRSGPMATRPWTKDELRALALKVVVAVGALLIVFLPLNYIEQVTKRNCAAECAKANMDCQVFFFRCTCVHKAK